MKPVFISPEGLLEDHISTPPTKEPIAEPTLFELAEASARKQSTKKETDER
jgi:hypothetical protein